MSRSSYGRLSKRVKVTHRMTPYDVAVRSVILSDSDLTTERRNILEGEVLMEKDTDRSLYLSNHRHVHSDQDAWTYSSDPNDDNGNTLLREKVTNFRYAGIAVTGYDGRHGVYQQGFMSTIGGLNSIMNTGTSTLSAGKEVYVVPTKESNENHNLIGVPRNKNLFATVHDDDPQWRLAAANALPQLAGNVLDERGNAGNKEEWDRRATAAMRKFCIGTVLRGGRKSQLVDVVLHSSAHVIHVSA